MFSIGLEFLGHTYYASNPLQGARAPEWPPHPDRIFSALVATAYSLSQQQPLDDQTRHALTWFEALPAPIWYGPLDALTHSRSHQRNYQTHQVPYNSHLKGEWKTIQILPNQRKSAGQKYIHSVTAERPGFWVWPNHTASPAIHAVLANLLRHCVRIGTSASFVQAWIANPSDIAEANADGPRSLIPDSQAQTHSPAVFIRLPYPGRLQALEDAYQIHKHPIPSIHIQPYRIHHPFNVLPWESLGVLRIHPTHYRPLLFESLRWSETLRNAVLKHWISSTIPASIHGHDRTVPHIAWVPLADVGFSRSDGHLLGIAVWVPPSMPIEERNQLIATLNRIESLVSHPFTVPVTFHDRQAMQALRIPQGLRWQRWTTPATQWASVTPIVWERFPNPRTISRIAQSMVEHARITTSLTAVTIDPYPAWHGSAPASAFFARRASSVPSPFVSHITLTFAEPIHGPVILGKLRHFGLGLCLPIPENPSVELTLPTSSSP
jgi:CRISPR-associated protein Csb2